MSTRKGEAFYGPPLAIPIGADGARGYEYPPTGEIFPSVTTIGKVLPKPALEGWAAKETAGAAWDNREAILLAASRETVVRMLSGARYESLDRSGRIGSLVHRIIEALSGEAPMPEIKPTAQPYVDAFLAFVDQFSPTFRHVEATVFSPTHRYAGTLDFVAEIDGLTVLGDHKTGSGIYRDHAMQLAALRYADEIWDPETGDLLPMIKIDGCIGVHLQPEGVRVLEIRADESVFEAFLAARALWPWACGGGDARCIGPALSRTRLVKTFGKVPA